MLCAPLDWQYPELPLSASDAVLYTVLVCNQIIIIIIKTENIFGCLKLNFSVD